MLFKLRAKLVATNMLIVLLVLLVMFALVYGTTRRDLERESLEMMRPVASEPFMHGKLTGNQTFAPYLVLQISRDGAFVTVEGYMDMTDPDLLSKLVRAAVDDGGETGVLPEYNLRYCFGSGVWGRSLVFADMSGERSTLASLTRTCLLIGAASLAAFLVISLLLARWAVRPVERAWEQQRRFVADASHELKTPLTVILTNAELLAAPGGTEEDRAKYAGNILTVSRQMRLLIQDLLDLARMENGRNDADFEPLDLSVLVSDAALPFEPLYFEAGLELRTDIEPGVRVRGSATRLRQAAEILLDNALKYSAPGAVTLTLKRRGRRALLTLRSPGEPLSEAELTDIFRRFYRADRARPMTGSYGLGLPIASGIVRDHRGRIRAESGDAWNDFIIELPAI